MHWDDREGLQRLVMGAKMTLFMIIMKIRKME